MDYSQAITAMQSYFNDNYDSSLIVWGNDDYKNPPDTWVRFNILHSDGFQATSGSPTNNRFERRGIITVQVFTKNADYGVANRTLCTAILKLYEGISANDIQYFDAYVKEVGQDGRGYLQNNVLTSFRYSEIT